MAAAARVTPEPEPSGVRQMVREFLSRYRHPNAINGQDWTDADVGRLARVAECIHQPGPRDQRHGGRRCTLCDARMEES